MNLEHLLRPKFFFRKHPKPPSGPHEQPPEVTDDQRSGSSFSLISHPSTHDLLAEATHSSSNHVTEGDNAINEAAILLSQHRKVFSTYPQFQELEERMRTLLSQSTNHRAKLVKGSRIAVFKGSGSSPESPRADATSFLREIQATINGLVANAGTNGLQQSNPLVAPVPARSSSDPLPFSRTNVELGHRNSMRRHGHRERLSKSNVNPGQTLLSMVREEVPIKDQGAADMIHREETGAKRGKTERTRNRHRARQERETISDSSGKGRTRDSEWDPHRRHKHRHYVYDLLEEPMERQEHKERGIDVYIERERIKERERERMGDTEAERRRDVERTKDRDRGKEDRDARRDWGTERDARRDWDKRNSRRDRDMERDARRDWDMAREPRTARRDRGTDKYRNREVSANRYRPSERERERVRETESAKATDKDKDKNRHKDSKRESDREKDGVEYMRDGKANTRGPVKVELDDPVNELAKKGKHRETELQVEGTDKGKGREREQGVHEGQGTVRDGNYERRDGYRDHRRHEYQDHIYTSASRSQHHPDRKEHKRSQSHGGHHHGYPREPEGHRLYEETRYKGRKVDTDKRYRDRVQLGHRKEVERPTEHQDSRHARRRNSDEGSIKMIPPPGWRAEQDHAQQHRKSSPAIIPTSPSAPPTVMEYPTSGLHRGERNTSVDVQPGSTWNPKVPSHSEHVPTIHIVDEHGNASALQGIDKPIIWNQASLTAPPEQLKPKSRRIPWLPTPKGHSGSRLLEIFTPPAANSQRRLLPQSWVG